MFYVLPTSSLILRGATWRRKPPRMIESVSSSYTAWMRAFAFLLASSSSSVSHTRSCDFAASIAPNHLPRSSRKLSSSHILFLPRSFLRTNQPLPAVPAYATTVTIPVCNQIRTLHSPIATAALTASPRITIRFGSHLLQGPGWLRVCHFLALSLLGRVDDVIRGDVV